MNIPKPTSPSFDNLVPFDEVTLDTRFDFNKGAPAATFKGRFRGLFNPQHWVALEFIAPAVEGHGDSWARLLLSDGFHFVVEREAVVTALLEITPAPICIECFAPRANEASMWLVNPAAVVRVFNSEGSREIFFPGDFYLLSPRL